MGRKAKQILYNPELNDIENAKINGVHKKQIQNYRKKHGIKSVPQWMPTPKRQLTEKEKWLVHKWLKYDYAGKVWTYAKNLARVSNGVTSSIAADIVCEVFTYIQTYWERDKYDLHKMTGMAIYWVSRKLRKQYHPYMSMSEAQEWAQEYFMSICPWDVIGGEDA